MQACCVYIQTLKSQESQGPLLMVPDKGHGGIAPNQGCLDALFHPLEEWWVQCGTGSLLAYLPGSRGTVWDSANEVWIQPASYRVRLQQATRLGSCSHHGCLQMGRLSGLHQPQVTHVHRQHSMRAAGCADVSNLPEEDRSPPEISTCRHTGNIE